MSNIFLHKGEKLKEKEKTIEELLLKGRESANKLQILLQKPVANFGSDSTDELSLNIFNSFSLTLSMVNQNINLDANESSHTVSQRNNINKLGPTDRRGCYIRGNGNEPRIKVSATIDDGYVWRKYGQKDINNSEFPRCYYRCTHKYDQGCKATKQVQKKTKDSLLYQMSYFGHHTCDINTSKSLKTISHIKPKDSCLLSFKSKPKINPDIYSDQTVINQISFSGEKLSDGVSHGNSSVLNPCLCEGMITSDLSTTMTMSEIGSDNCFEEMDCNFTTQESFRAMDLMDYNKLVDLENDIYFDENGFK